jgi:hypothetical protein
MTANLGDVAERLREASGRAHWRLHDVRRSAVSTMAEHGVPFEVADALLNHAQSATRGGLTGVYQKAKLLEPMRNAVAVWETALSRH